MMKHVLSILTAAGLALGLLSAGGCAQQDSTGRNAEALYYAGNFQGAAALVKPKTTEKNESFVLNNCRYGSAALAAGQLKEAEDAFMAAYEVINSVNTNNGGRTMGATLVWEGVKVWKGEPFERAMAHYYLGLAALVQNPPDYDTAKAAFTNSLFKLREYAKENGKKPESEQYKEIDNDFALGYFGIGYCWLKRGDPGKADDCFKAALKLKPALATVINEIKRPEVNVLVFVDAGHGPKKAPKGWYNEESAFGPTPAEAGPIQPIGVYADGKLANTGGARYDLVDTLALAQKAQWQDIDTVRKVKAAVGTGMMAAGTGMAAYGASRGDSRMELAGLAVALGGAALAASSQADVRYWELLPRSVYVVPLALPPGAQTTIAVKAGNAGSAGLPLQVRPKAKPSDPDQVLYFRLP